MSEILQKIKKLLALASSDNPNEAAVAMAAANRMMLEHRITLAEVNDASEPTSYGYEPIERCQRIMHWKARLFAVIADHTGCVVVRRGWGSEKLWLFAGSLDNACVAKDLAQFAMSIIPVHAAKVCRGMGRNAHASYCIGMVDGIHIQLLNQSKAAKATCSTSALAAIDSDQDRVKAWLDSLPGMSTLKMKASNTDAFAYGRGVIDGKRVDLGTQPKLEQR